jgi:uncharacterized protein YciI
MGIDVVQRSYFVVQMTTRFDSLQRAMSEAPDAMAAHIARSKQLHADGALLMSGAFLDHPGEPVQTMGVLISFEAAEDYALNDPFVIAGMVESSEIREWANIFGTGGPT